MVAAVLATVWRRRRLAGVTGAVGAGMGGAEAACRLRLMETLIDGALVGRTVLGGAAVDVELGLVAAGAVAGVMLAVVRA